MAWKSGFRQCCPMDCNRVQPLQPNMCWRDPDERGALQKGDFQNESLGFITPYN